MNQALFPTVLSVHLLTGQTVAMIYFKLAAQGISHHGITAHTVSASYRPGVAEAGRDSSGSTGRQTLRLAT